jgi:PhnB protein
MDNPRLNEQLDRVIQSLIAASGGIPALIGDGLYGDGAALEAEAAELVPVARALVGLPRADFKTRLKAELERGANMASSATTQTTHSTNEAAAQPKYRTVTPYLAVRGAEECLRFVQQTFGATLTAHYPLPHGGLHAEVRIGDSPLMIGSPAVSADGAPTAGRFFPAMLHVRVGSCDETYRRALAAGGTSMLEPRDMDYGERGASVRDASGNHWYIAQPFAKTHWLPEMTDVTPYLHPKSAASLIDFATRAFGAKEIERHAEGGVVYHAKILVGDSVLEMSDAREPEVPATPAMFYMHLEGQQHVKLWFDGALAAGAEPLGAPALAPYGDFVGSVEDPSGNYWYIAASLKAQAGADTNSSAHAAKPDGSAATTVSYIRKGFRTLTPYLIVNGAAREIDWMKAALGAAEIFRVAPGNGEKIMHAELRVAENVVELSDATAEFPARATMNMLYVADPDAAYARALAAGGTSMYPVTTKPWGDRDGVVVSPGGVTWCLTSRGPGEHITPDTPSLVTGFTADNANAYVEFMKRAFGAVEIFAHRTPGGALVHGRVRIGDSVLGGGDMHAGPSGGRSSMPFLMHMYVPDVDAIYAAALAAGATSVRGLEDAPYGDRTATIADPAGNLWSLATHIRDVKF